jgi:hypothetical protein
LSGSPSRADRVPELATGPVGARLTVSGRTNVETEIQLFLSTRTVEWHLSKMYTKLGVGSRRELRLTLGGLGQTSRNLAGALRAPRAARL